MNACIEVLNTHQRGKIQAEAIAKHYNTTYENAGKSWLVECNKELEDAFCVDDETFDEAIAEVEAATGVYINPEDICF